MGELCIEELDITFYSCKYISDRSTKRR